MAMRLERPFQIRFTINYFRKVFTEFPETGNIRTLIDSKATVVFYHSLKASLFERLPFENFDAVETV